MSYWDKIQDGFNKGNSPIRKLIIINIAVFILSGLVLMIGRGRGVEHAAKAKELLVFFHSPAAFADFLSKPWSVATYMFFHNDLFHIAGNMILLFYIGRILLDFQNNKKFYTLYFGGGIMGALLYMFVYQYLPSFAGSGLPMQGASGGVMSVVVASAVLVPNYELSFFRAFRIKLKWIALFLVGINVLYLTTGNQGGHLAHLGGALFATLFVLNEQGRLNLSLLRQIRNPFRPRFAEVDERDILRGKKEKVKTEATSAPHQARSHANGKPRQEEIDAILDKINQSGYPSLTKEEKDLLFRASDK
ncbi:MAG: membrane associated rhomboid family serine protease [Bacteroidia bacterium]|jgi:membrane associated rhomboid family serine protease